MQKHVTSLSILIISFVLFIGCKKDKDEPSTKTKTELITQASWKFDKATSSSIDVSGAIPACWKDNIAIFVSNGTGSLDESTQICSPSAAGAFTWSFQTNETILHLSAPLFSTGSNDFTLVSITETNLVISQNVTVPPAGSQNVVFTFKH
jgi:hypothetical protein